MSPPVPPLASGASQFFLLLPAAPPSPSPCQRGIPQSLPPARGEVRRGANYAYTIKSSTRPHQAPPGLPNQPLAFERRRHQYMTLSPTTALLDLRTPPAYQSGHHLNASHLPFAALIMRRHELPPPGTPLRVLHDDAADLTIAVSQLQDWSYPVVSALLVDAERLAHWRQSGELVTGQSSERLWQANGALELALPRWSHPAQPASGPARALDLACGSGRDALLLAMHGYDVLAIDHKVDALARLKASASALQLVIHTRCCDLEDPAFALADAAFDLVTIARYLHRPLLPRLRDWLAPGGLLVYETFARGAERFSGPKRAEYLLEQGELSALFADWSILLAQVVSLADGRPVQQFVARRPLS